ncbi:alkaline phosphatase family protein [Paenibacillus alkaliterrae]|uniref:alkaline phosphatase family protein n=1 Tax=Paenibacillus alkaliterrae TaxID=320909 RepID=UPI001F433652|nr:alkaline phosphatase family protein [Paenibacillus alkaliterrae]MCF2938007.1 alkaline phosphatase family protein [Paenibacillus alkaliterrae]
MEKIARVFIIGWDGAGNFVKAAHTPNLDRLIRMGTFGFDAQTVSPTISAQCWGSLLHGVGPDKHGLTNEIVSEDTYPENSPYPSIFQIVRDSVPDAKMVAFSAWNPINHGIIESSIGVHKVSMNDRDLSLAAAAYIRENPDLKLMFIGLDLPDAGGHQYGYNTPGQHQAIEETDENTGIIIRAIEETGLLTDSLIIAVTDHGGGGEHSHSHGSDHPSDKTIFWGCAGPGIKPDSPLQGDFVITDTAAVVIRALGLTAPSAWEAKLPEGLFFI